MPPKKAVAKGQQQLSIGYFTPKTAVSSSTRASSSTSTPPTTTRTPSSSSSSSYSTVATTPPSSSKSTGATKRKMEAVPSDKPRAKKAKPSPSPVAGPSGADATTAIELGDSDDDDFGSDDDDDFEDDNAVVFDSPFVTEADDEDDEESDDGNGELKEGDLCATLGTAVTKVVAAIRRLPSLAAKVKSCKARDDALVERFGLRKPASKDRATVAKLGDGDLRAICLDLNFVEADGFKARLTAFADGTGPAFDPSDAMLDPASPIPAYAQRLHRFWRRVCALHASVDKVDQLNIDGPALHAVDNVQVVPALFNMSKRGGLHEVAMTHQLALYMHQSGLDVGGLAAFMNAMSALHAGSVSRQSVTGRERVRLVADLAELRGFLDGEVTGYDWRGTLPEPKIKEIIAMYSHRPSLAFVESIKTALLSPSSRARIDDLIVKIKGIRADAPELPRNEDLLPVLFFDEATSTDQLARFVGCIVLRYIHECGRAYPLLPEWLDPVAIFLHLVQACLVHGYIRRPGLLGTIDPASGLPHAHGGLPGAPGRVTYLGHDSHGLPVSAFETADDARGNHSFESWLTNNFRGSYPFSTLCGYMSAMRPALQAWADKLAAVGVIDKLDLPEFQPSDQLVAMWGSNQVTKTDAVLRKPELVKTLKERYELVKERADVEAEERRTAQQDADAVAGDRFLLPGRCSSCGAASTEEQCGACRVMERRLATYATAVSSFESAAAAAKKRGWKSSPDAQLGSSPRVPVVAPLPPATTAAEEYATIGYGRRTIEDALQTPPPKPYSSYECAECLRSRTTGRTVVDGRVVCQCCAQLHKVKTDEYRARGKCFDCGCDSGGWQWYNGPVSGSLRCRRCWVESQAGDNACQDCGRSWSKQWHRDFKNPDRQICRQCWRAKRRRRYTCSTCPATYSWVWYPLPNGSKDQKQCTKCHGPTRRPGTCVFPDGCDATESRQWYHISTWLPGVTGKVCERHRSQYYVAANPRPLAADLPLLPGTCNYPDCTRATDKHWYKWPLAHHRGTVCHAHFSFLYRNKDKPQDDQGVPVPPPPPPPKPVPVPARDRAKVAGTCAYTGCVETSDKYWKAWPGANHKGRLCLTHYNKIKRSK